MDSFFAAAISGAQPELPVHGEPGSVRSSDQSRDHQSEPTHVGRIRSEPVQSGSETGQEAIERRVGPSGEEKFVEQIGFSGGVGVRTAQNPEQRREPTKPDGGFGAIGCKKFGCATINHQSTVK